ncbi:MAG: WYL domain-containing protein [Eubacteriales bacterium]|nr:WYL domain-containing protein [Eubacteriales bacterium]
MATHKELIKAHKFDEKFKNSLRDYYSYGFKSSARLTRDRSEQTLLEDWDRLNNILQDYVEWSDKSERREVMYATQESQSMRVNPFHRVYRFCIYPETYPAYFFHTVAALSPCISLREGVESLSKSLKEQKRLERVIDAKNLALSEEIGRLHLRREERDLLKRFYEEEDLFLEKLRELGLGDGQTAKFESIIARNEVKLKTSDLIYFFTDQLAASTGRDRNNTPNNRLEALEQLGIVAREQPTGQKGKKGDRRWQIRPFTLKKLIAAGSAADEKFEYHFRTLLDFFSRYYFLGELGTFLLDRMKIEENSSFCFKHEYFMQSLNDFNLIDLICAIENGYWCRIRYRHGTAEFATELLCYPLEIRVSSAGGRQYLMFYEPFRRSYTGLRVEFIDSVEYYSGSEVCRVLKETEKVSPEEIKSDIANARWSLHYSWGVSTTPIQEGNAMSRAPLGTIAMRVLYDGEKEYYIRNRLLRERRNGNVDFVKEEALDYSVNVSDVKEMGPWIRSFYSRIAFVRSTPQGRFSLDSDVASFAEHIFRDKVKVPEENQTAELNARTEENQAAESNAGPKAGMDKTPGGVWGIPENAAGLLGKGRAAREHEKLFNEVFSIYYYVMADVFVRLCSDEALNSFTEKELERIILRSFYSMYQRLGMKTAEILPEEIKNLFLTKGFVTKTKKRILQSEDRPGRQREEYVDAYSFKYCCDENICFYRDVVPMTILEIRWLKTILKDRRAGYFLNREEIAAANQALERYFPDEASFPMQKVIYYDQYKISEESEQRESALMGTILDAINRRETVRIKYRTNHGRIQEKEYMPVVLEFSKRNNRFQAYCSSTATGRISAINLSQIISAENLKKPFDYDLARERLRKYRKRRQRYVDIEFYDRKADRRNLADRILMELSPWKKRCTCDTEKELYRLRVFYQADDENELVIRLMGYGNNIHILDHTRSIGLEVEKRIEKQCRLLHMI